MIFRGKQIIVWVKSIKRIFIFKLAFRFFNFFNFEKWTPLTFSEPKFYFLFFNSSYFMLYELNYFSFHVAVDKLLEDLVTQLLALDPADRPNVKQARQHDWCRKKFPRSSQVSFTRIHLSIFYINTLLVCLFLCIQ